MTNERSVERREWKRPELKTEKVISTGVSFGCTSAFDAECPPGQFFCADPDNMCISCSQSCEPV